jgi:glycosyltransferase involved in cell wall biosynthesis
MISYYLPGDSKIGAGYQAHHLANEMVRRGHQVTMLSPCSRPADARYELQHVDVGSSLRTFRFAARLRHVNLGGFDVVHAHGDDYLLPGDGPSRLRTMHGSCFAEALHITGLAGRVRMFALGLSEWLASMRADKTVCVSDNTRRWMPWVRTVIPNGVDLGRFDGSTPRSTVPSILFVGTYQNRKRGWLLQSAFLAEVLPRMPNAELWMVCSDAPEAPNVRVLGTVSDVELAKLYARAWLFCLPSTYEGFGIPYVEAMAAGTPVVSSPNAGAREVLGQGAFGSIVADDDLGSTLADLMGDAERRARHGQRGRERARDYSLDVVSARYEELYRTLIERRRTRPRFGRPRPKARR